jgi:hypothetical protein
MTMHQHDTGLFTAKLFTDYYAAMVLDEEGKERFVYAFDEGKRSLDYLRRHDIDVTNRFVWMRDVTLEDIKKQVYLDFYLAEFFQVAFSLLDSRTPDDILDSCLDDVMDLMSEEPVAGSEFLWQMFGHKCDLEDEFVIFGEFEYQAQRDCLRKMFIFVASMCAHEYSKSSIMQHLG